MAALALRWTASFCLSAASIAPATCAIADMPLIAIDAEEAAAAVPPPPATAAIVIGSHMIIYP